jgi:N,N'-diacetyllegionaminate synthase
VIERHFTYDKESDGPDHMLSADPQEMKWLVDAVRTFEIMRGTGIKRPADSEKITRYNNRKSLVIEHAVKAGESLSASNIAIKRPGYGISPKNYEQVIGRKVKTDLHDDAILTWSDLE